MALALYQIRKIKTAQSKLKIKDADYREMLSGFITEKGKPAISCKELNQDQYQILIETFEKLGFKPKRKIENRFAKYDGRGGRFATSWQMEKVFYLWEKNSKEKTLSSLIKFAKRIIKVDDISFWQKRDMSKLIKAVEVIKSKKVNVQSEERN